ncbi:EndoU domain-containing protein [Nocardia thailandica]
MSRDGLASAPAKLGHPAPVTGGGQADALAALAEAADQRTAELLGRFTRPGHILGGETKGQGPVARLGGMHHLPSSDLDVERVITFTKADNRTRAVYLEVRTPNGIARKHIDPENGLRHTTFDPDLSPLEVLTDIAAAFDNATIEAPGPNGNARWTGVAPSGITIQGYCTPDGRIVTAFPEWEDTTTLHIPHEN